MIRLESNGDYWTATWTNSVGKRERKSLGAKSKVSKAGAKRLMVELAKKVVTSTATRDGVKAPTLSAWRVTYFDSRNDLAPSTVKLHEDTFDYLQEFAAGDIRLSDFTRNTAAEFRTHLQKLDAMGAATVSRHIRTAKVIFQAAADRDLIDYNPFDRQSGTAPRVEKTWAEIDAVKLGKILDACPSTAWRVLFGLARWGGLRRGEALRVAWGNVDWEGRIIRVMAAEDSEGRRKVTTKQRAREIPLRPVLYAMLRDAFDAAPAGSEGPCGGINAENLDRDVRRLIKRAIGATYSKPFHTLRKNCETEWMAEHPIMDVCAWMGHSATVASEFYVRVKPESVAKVTGAKPEGVTV